jgi:hypothetical protein
VVPQERLHGELLVGVGTECYGNYHSKVSVLQIITFVSII